MTKPMYFYNGSTFEQVGPTVPQSPIAYQTSAPTGPATGDLWIDSDGDVDTYTRQLTRYKFVASGGETSLSGPDANNVTLAYTSGSEMVYLNGALLNRGSDYVATNGTSITSLAALSLNDIVEVFAYVAFNPANSISATVVDAKGDLIVATAADTVGRLAVGTNGQLLAADSTTSTGLKWANPGMTLISTTTLSATTAATITNLFSSTYDNYVIYFNITASATNRGYMYFRAGSTNTTTGYVETMTASNGTWASDETNSNRGEVSFNVFTTDPAATVMNVYNPNLAKLTATTWESVANYSYNMRTGVCFLNNNTQYDGIYLFTGSANTLSGTVSVYGINK